MAVREAVPPDDEAPPFLGTWPHVYRAVLAYLGILIVALYLVSAHFTY